MRGTRTTFTSLSRYGVGLLAMSLLTVACGSDDDSGSTASDAERTETSTTTSDSKPSGEPSAAQGGQPACAVADGADPKSGGSFSYAMVPAFPGDSLDPVLIPGGLGQLMTAL